MTVDAEQRARLLRTKLLALTRALVGDDHRSAPATLPDPVNVGAVTALVVDGHAYVLAEAGSAAALASAILWTRRQDATRLTVFTDDHASDMARWASYFVLGHHPIAVRAVVGAGSESASPSSLPTVPPEPVDADALIAQLRGAGAEVVMEHGVVRGEVHGLEVARLVTWPTETGGDGELHLEPGVGRFDRDAVAAAHPDEAPSVGLERSVRSVSAHRYPGAPAHPTQMLARERWLRADLVADPSLVGATDLDAVGMTTQAEGLRDVHPAAAIGVDAEGLPLVVVCSSGVDLALVPLAADTRQLLDPDARLVLALPERDLHAATATLAQMLLRPAELVAVPPGWG